MNSQFLTKASLISVFSPKRKNESNPINAVSGSTFNSLFAMLFSAKNKNGNTVKKLFGSAGTKNGSFLAKSNQMAGLQNYNNSIREFRKFEDKNSDTKALSSTLLVETMSSATKKSGRQSGLDHTGASIVAGPNNANSIPSEKSKPGNTKINNSVKTGQWANSVINQSMQNTSSSSAKKKSGRQSGLDYTGTIIVADQNKANSIPSGKSKPGNTKINNSVNTGQWANSVINKSTQNTSSSSAKKKSGRQSGLDHTGTNIVADPNKASSIPSEKSKPGNTKINNSVKMGQWANSVISKSTQNTDSIESDKINRLDGETASVEKLKLDIGLAEGSLLAKFSKKVEYENNNRNSKDDDVSIYHKESGKNKTDKLNISFNKPLITGINEKLHPSHKKAGNRQPAVKSSVKINEKGSIDMPNLKIRKEVSDVSGIQDAKKSNFTERPFIIQTAHAIVNLKNSGETKLTVMLSPPSMGKMKIELKSDKNGVDAKLVVDIKEVKEIMDSAVSDIKDVISKQGVNIRDIAVELAPDQQNSRDFGDSLNRNKNSETFNQWKQSNFGKGGRDTAPQKEIEKDYTRYFGYNSMEIIA